MLGKQTDLVTTWVPSQFLLGFLNALKAAAPRSGLAFPPPQATMLPHSGTRRHAPVDSAPRQGERPPTPHL
jgi:hypothetical protein